MWRQMFLFILLRFLPCVWKVIPYRKGMSWGMCSLQISKSKKYYIYSLGQLERLYNAISDKNKNLNLICFVSLKNQNWEMYCLLFWNFRLGQISHTIFGGAEAWLREECVKKNAYCFLLKMAHFLIFIHNGGIWKGTIQPRLKNGTHFSCYESLPKRYNVQMSNCLTLAWDATSRNGQRQVWWPKCAATHSPRKIKLAAQ